MSSETRLVPGYVIKLVFKLSPYMYYYRIRNCSHGWFYYKRCWWVDISTLPSEVSVAIQHYSVLFNKIDKKKIRRLQMKEKFQLMALMLTLDEVSRLTRISKESLKKAIIFGQIKSINFGGNEYISRVELERVLGCLIDEHRVNCVCHPF